MKNQFSKKHLIVLIVSLSTIAVLTLMWTASSLASPAQAPDAPLAPVKPPTMINYQGTIRKDGSPYNGTGYFKFAVMNSPSGKGTSNYWAHDGTTAFTPTTYITLTVTNGLFNVLLGDTSVTSMTEIISDTVFQFSNSYLRVWFSDDGSSFQALEPNQKFASVAYALRCTTCEYAKTYTETDPIFTGHTAYGINSTHISNWNAAYTHSLQPYDTTNDYWGNNGSFVYSNNDVGIGGMSPSTKLHIQDGGTSTTPQFQIEMGGSGDAAMRYFQGGTVDFSTGIYGADGHFKLTNSSSLAASSQGDTVTMLQAHPNGILDFNNQSRARAYLTATQSIPSGVWMPIEFQNDFTLTGGYDEQNEFLPSTGPMIPGQFIATVDGYYQVHARTVFSPTVQFEPSPGVGLGYVSIAIFVTDPTGLLTVYAQGNNLQMLLNRLPPEEWTYLLQNNAPNVSDVVYLRVGDIVEIHAFQNISPGPVPLGTGSSQTYVSIHKDS